MSSDDPRSTTADRESIDISRRDFAKAAGGAALFAGATDAGAADQLRQTDRTPIEGTVDTITESFTPQDWYTIAPFQYQRRDTSVGSLFPRGGADDFSTGESTPSLDGELQSAFAGGSEVRWEQVQASGGTVGFPQARSEIDPTGGNLTPLTDFGGGAGGLFDDFQDWFGIGGSLYGKGYAFTTFEVDGPKRAVLETDATVWLNGHRHEESPAGVVLQDGTNYLLASSLLIYGFIGSVTLTFRPPEAPVEVNGPATFRGIPQNIIVPDLRVGEETDLPASVRVTNTTGEPVDEATLTVAPDNEYLVEQQVDIDPPLAPFETRRVNTRIQTGTGAAGSDSSSTQAGNGGGDGNGQQGGPPGELPDQAKANATRSTTRSEVTGEAMTHTPPETGQEAESMSDSLTSMAGDDVSTTTLETSRDVLSVTARAEVGDQRHSETVDIRVADADANRRMTTFESEIDGSVQYFTYRRPANDESSTGPYEVVFSLHGANVNSWNQAGANIPREDAYVVAPDARGPVNYDHEDLGRVDDLEALRVAMDRFDLDESNVYISGHSMGGHGTWHIGLTNNDRFAALAPSSGWTDHETYITVVWGRDKLHAYPGLKALKEKALQKNLAMPKTQNAEDGNTPIFVLQGGEDTSVPSMQPRSYVRALANRGLDVDGEVGYRHQVTPADTDVAYLEVPNADHYWDKNEFSDETIGPGKDTVNHPDMFEFIRSSTNDPYPESLTFFTTNLRIEDGKHWVRVVEQDQVHAPTRVDASVSSDGIHVETENVARLEVDTQVLREVDVDADSRVYTPVGSASLPGRGHATVDLSGNGVRANRGRGRPSRGVGKDADQYGPMKEIHQKPYRLVYGTQASDAETAMNRNLANIRSQRLVTRARAPATVIPDTAVDRATMDEYNLILFGRPSANSVYQQVQQSIPVRVGDGTVRIKDDTWSGDLAVSLLYPNPRNREKLLQIETGTSLAGVQLTRVRDWTPTQTAAADYMVFDESVRFQKWNACVAAGYFDKHWQVDDELGFRRQVETR
ncbi:prolyl oligopeptidase family serine peptidase [Haloarchaeobius amylolyticus]|uniref:prolyl oligopeptidase family serine peptidase n=1 Tax=Haloarchaeobius amylolyticus TaxID=1198296 RepID=UPI00226D49B7|nr:prolyl oligopeptidase family serine peptidase [Haloarchaeobius amylolyticus]